MVQLGSRKHRRHYQSPVVRARRSDDDRGVLSQEEKALIHRLARSFGIGRIAMRGAFWEIERELGIKRKLRISQSVTMVTIVIAFLLVWFTFKQFSRKSMERFDESRINLDELKTELGFERTKAEEALRQVRESQADLEEREMLLEMQLEELDRKSADERASLSQGRVALGDSFALRLEVSGQAISTQTVDGQRFAICRPSGAGEEDRRGSPRRKSPLCARGDSRAESASIARGA